MADDFDTSSAVPVYQQQTLPSTPNPQSPENSSVLFNPDTAVKGDTFTGVDQSPFIDPSGARMGNSPMHHYINPQGQEIMSPNPAPAGSKPYVTPGPNDSQESDPMTEGLGKFYTDQGRGVRQIALHIGNHLGLVSDEGLAKEQEDLKNSRQLDQPLMNTTGGKFGNFLGAVSEMGLGGASIGGQAAVGAGIGASQPTLGDESRTGNTVFGGLGAAAGAAVGKFGGRLIRPFTQNFDPETTAGAQKLADINLLKSHGIPLDAGQQTGSKAAETLGRVVQDAPFVGGTDLPARQLEASTRAVSHTIGEDSPVLDNATMSVAAARTQKVGNDILQRNPYSVGDPTTWNNLQGLSQDAERVMTKPADANQIKGPIAKLIQNQIPANGDARSAVEPDVWRSVRGEVSALSQDSNPSVRHYGELLGNEMDDGLARQITNPEDAKAWEINQQQIRNRKLLEPAIDKNTNQVSLPKLANSIDAGAKNRNMTTYATGNGPENELWNLARAGSNVLPNKVGNSGTASRLMGQVGVGGAVGAGLAAYEAPPGEKLREGVKYGLLGAAVPMAARSAVEGRLSSALVRSANSPTVARVIKAGTHSLAGAGAYGAMQVAPTNIPGKKNESTQ